MELQRQETSLHQFMSDHRDEVLRIALDDLHTKAPHVAIETLRDGMPAVFDEIVRALRHEAGLAERSPLPRHSEVAASIGRTRQRDGLEIALVAFTFGAISSALGDVASAANAAFPAREYQVFNQCIDTSISLAIEEYAAQERAQQGHEEAKRLGSLAHEIRNALGSATMAHAALQTGVVGIHSKTGEVLGRSLATIQTLVNQALDAVRLQGGRAATRHAVPVEPLFAQVKAAAVLDRGISIQAEADQRLKVMADENLLLSALTNLLQNALKFTKDGGVVSMRARSEGDSVLMEVEDRCGGLPEGAQEELLTPFVQRGTDRSGLGLGLAITREAVEKQGGRLVLRNLPGTGCVFSIALPAAP